MLAAVILGLVCGNAGAQTGAAAAADDTEFARIDLTEDGDARALQVAIVSYAPQTGENSFTVDLIGAVHVGDRGYYAELNARFRRYDALLYEMVAPPGASVPTAGAARSGIVANAQLAMRSALGLEYQLDEIDYSAPNFVHADLSPDELRERMRERGESLYVYFWRAFYASIREARRDPLGLNDLGLLSALMSPADDQSFKASMAYELADVNRVGELLDGENGSALIAERNQRAIDVLKAELDAGASRVGIFYGVAHMPDFERRLAAELDLKAVTTRWVDAWRLADEAPEALR